MLSSRWVRALSFRFDFEMDYFTSLSSQSSPRLEWWTHLVWTYFTCVRPDNNTWLSIIVALWCDDAMAHFHIWLANPWNLCMCLIEKETHILKPCKERRTCDFLSFRLIILFSWIEFHTHIKYLWMKELVGKSGMSWQDSLVAYFWRRA